MLPSAGVNESQLPDDPHRLVAGRGALVIRRELREMLPSAGVNRDPNFLMIDSFRWVGRTYSRRLGESIRRAVATFGQIKSS